MVSLTAFTKHKFDTQKEARELLKLLSEDGSLFRPAKYGVSEQARHTFDQKNVRGPVQMLSGEPGDRGGGIFLKGTKYKAQASIQWGESGISDWYIEIDDKFFLNNEDGTERFIQFLARLFSRFPAEFCGAAPEEDWKAKHWRIERTAFGEVHEKRGLEISQCLPGLYWVTLMGKTLVQRFGKTNLKQLPIHRTVDLGDHGLLLVLRDAPYSTSLNERLEQDRRIVSLIGDQFFFDIENLGKTCEGIADLVASQVSSGIRENRDSGEKENDQFSNFEQQRVLSPEGTPYEDPEYLAEAVVVYFHGELKEVFGYSLSALKALDTYFTIHPPQREFEREFLATDLIPALGAYLGKVFTRELGGKWVIRNPIMKSTVTKGNKHRNPFRDAYAVIMEGKRLVEAYDAFQES